MTTAPKTSTAPAVTSAPAATTVVAIEKSAPAKTATPKAATVRAQAVKSQAPAVKSKAVAIKPKPVMAAAEKPAKVKKPKLVRDSFTIPKTEYTVLDDLKQRAITLAQPAKKSELLRAGIKALAAMSDAAFRSALLAVPTIKTGRPAATLPVASTAKKAVKKVAK